MIKRYWFQLPRGIWGGEHVGANRIVVLKEVNAEPSSRKAKAASASWFANAVQNVGSKAVHVVLMMTNAADAGT